jgi:hypothetical protein
MNDAIGGVAARARARASAPRIATRILKPLGPGFLDISSGKEASLAAARRAPLGGGGGETRGSESWDRIVASEDNLLSLAASFDSLGLVDFGAIGPGLVARAPDARSTVLRSSGLVEPPLPRHASS